MDHLTEKLVARVARLERANRRDRTIALAVLALLFVTAQAPLSRPSAARATGPVVVRDASGQSATLTASGLIVRDANGRQRLLAGLDSSGRPSLDLHDTKGVLRESMYLLDDLPVLRLFDSNDKRRAEFRLNAAQDGEFLIDDANEKLRLALFRAKSGDPQIGLYGSDEKLRAYFATDDVSPYLVMRDASGNTRVDVGGFTDGSIGLDLRDPSGTVIWKAP